MVYHLTYRRPSHVSEVSRPPTASSTAGSTAPSSKSGESSVSNKGIPEALSFDRIIAGGACPPCTPRDFMNYLKYVEHSAENLQFFLWFRGYCERFKMLPESEKVLSPEWTSAQADAEAAASVTIRRKKMASNIKSVLEGTDFADPKGKPVDARDTFTDPSSPDGALSEHGSSVDDGTLSGRPDFHREAEEALSDAGVKWQPFTAQPFREEIVRIIAIYIAVDGSRQLNLSGRERTAVLRALQSTTHPSALAAAVASAEFSLRRQAHPNFIRWTICNGNRPRVIFARGLGIALILIGIVADVLITLSSAGRAWRVLPVAGLIIGIATLVAGYKGMCVVLHGMHHRHLRPWELFTDAETSIELPEKGGFSVQVQEIGGASQETLVDNDAPSCSYEDEPWVVKYEKRNLIRKIFDREVWVQEPALRQIQDTIFVQSLLVAFVVSSVIVGVFCAVPHGGLF